jgi:ABC-type transport system substrate-binding protein
LGSYANLAPRWLDRLPHDGGATPDNFLNSVQDALIKNFRDKKFAQLALADQFDFAKDARSATARLRENIKFHDGSPVTPEDVKWSYEHHHGAWTKVLHDQTERISIRAAKWQDVYQSFISTGYAHPGRISSGRRNQVMQAKIEP